MHNHARLLLAGLAATAILAAAVSSASANSLSVSNQKIRATWASLELRLSFASEPTMACPVTLEGSFTSATIRKVVHALIGKVSVGRVNGSACSNGAATVNESSLPWHLTYESFVGRLPNITGVRLLLTGPSFKISTGGIECPATITAENPLYYIANLSSTTGQVEGLQADEAHFFIFDPTPSCLFLRGIFSGIASLKLLGNANSISIKLI